MTTRRDANPSAPRRRRGLVTAAKRATTTSDWLSKIATAPKGFENRVVAEATHWLSKVDADVRADLEEFGVQTLGMAHATSGQYGEHADAAAEIFISTVARLSGVRIAADEDQSDLDDDELDEDAETASDDDEADPAPDETDDSDDSDEEVEEVTEDGAAESIDTADTADEEENITPEARRANYRKELKGGQWWPHGDDPYTHVDNIVAHPETGRIYDVGRDDDLHDWYYGPDSIHMDARRARRARRANRKIAEWRHVPGFGEWQFRSDAVDGLVAAVWEGDGAFFWEVIDESGMAFWDQSETTLSSSSATTLERAQSDALAALRMSEQGILQRKSTRRATRKQAVGWRTIHELTHRFLEEEIYNDGGVFDPLELATFVRQRVVDELGFSAGDEAFVAASAYLIQNGYVSYPVTSRRATRKTAQWGETWIEGAGTRDYLDSIDGLVINDRWSETAASTGQGVEIGLGWSEGVHLVWLIDDWAGNQYDAVMAFDNGMDALREFDGMVGAYERGGDDYTASRKTAAERRYFVVNTDTGETLSGLYDTVEEAVDEMMRIAPLVEPWDGIEHPLAVDDTISAERAGTPYSFTATRRNAATERYEVSICVDCLFYAANGELPEDDPTFLERYHHGTEGGDLAVGDGEGYFSWSSCDICGSPLGGDRFDATLFVTSARRRSASSRKTAASKAVGSFFHDFGGVTGLVIEVEHDLHDSYSRSVQPAGVRYWQTNGNGQYHALVGGIYGDSLQNRLGLPTEASSPDRAVSYIVFVRPEDADAYNDFVYP